MEKILTKYFWTVNLITLAAVAYLLASGTSEIAASKVAELLPQPKTHATKPISHRSQKRVSWTAPDGSAILDRNIFDSTLGPISDEDVEDILDEDIPLEVSQNGLPVVPCIDGKVQLLATVASEHETSWSFASITNEGKKTLCRVGDEIAGRSVSGITWRYLFLRGTADECYIDMFTDQTKIVAKPKKAGDKATGKDDVANGIQKISETEHVVDRAIVDKLLADPTSFIRSVRVRPYKKGGKTVGFKLRRFRRNSPLALLGAQKGDIIHSVNGQALTSVDQALGAYQGLRSSNELTFSVTRKGKPMDLSVKIR
jgi:general secretion pathway protein C